MNTAAIGGIFSSAFLAFACAFAAPAEGESRIYTFEGTPENALPEGFQVGMTGTWKQTWWGVREIEGNSVLAHVGFWDEDPDRVFPVAWVENSRAKDLTLSVRLFPVEPPADVANAVHDGAGMIVRFRDPDNYYLLRAVPYETRVRFYKVVKGGRFTLAGSDVEVAAGRWHDLELRVRGNTFTASFDGTRLFTHQDDTFDQAGAFGLWCKPNNVTYYDDLKAEIVD